MTNIAIIGFGVVGGGITEVIRSNMDAIKRACGDEIYVKYILDLRDFPDSPYADRVIHDFDIIKNDPEVSIVCETMGGVNPAFDYSMKAMRAGKSVITSNKELVANRGVELMEEAKKNGVSYLFEASAGGGIPEIRSMRTSFAGDTISEIDGILNGTTNYILTKMKNEGTDFETALLEAKKLGYAEANPTADVDGFDAQRKIMILTAIVTNQLVSEDKVYTETMTIHYSSAIDGDNVDINIPVPTGVYNNFKLEILDENGDALFEKNYVLDNVVERATLLLMSPVEFPARSMAAPVVWPYFVDARVVIPSAEEGDQYG